MSCRGDLVSGLALSWDGVPEESGGSIGGRSRRTSELGEVRQAGLGQSETQSPGEAGAEAHQCGRTRWREPPRPCQGAHMVLRPRI